MGGGIKHDVLEQVWDYGFSTTEDTEKWTDHSMFDSSPASKMANSLYG
jgi:hypothetical protein